MSKLKSQKNWEKISNPTIPTKNLSGKYEKCRHITEEIYKRIEITFKIKKLEARTHSELSEESDQIDSLGNETDLFACDKSSLPSSTEVENMELGSVACEKYINNNNNEETKFKKTVVPYKRPKKRFRKRAKKQHKPIMDSDGSSDEGVSCNRVVDIGVVRGVSPPASLDNVMGIPNIVIVACGKVDCLLLYTALEVFATTIY
ncbi:uncharacterized protein LOC126977764 [Leptidea sinapis]|uniref:uncharacterized protein LOC126977764 n=1 Tax=Leptidea sinapis TaxID=189913 RepID=UPI0021C35D7A|nr:uncharacterized protein LOC126977764 [Leptidea sinapis]